MNFSFFDEIVTEKLFLKIENLSDEVRRSSGQLISREHTSGHISPFCIINCHSTYSFATGMSVTIPDVSNSLNADGRGQNFNENFLEIIQNVKVNQTSCFEQVHDAGVQDKTVI